MAVRALTDCLGYNADNVKEMPFENPGYDILARKDDIELRVEVKAHAGSANVVELTLRQYDEYRGQGKYHWELWNIEHLGEKDFHAVKITRYNNIPEEALDVGTFRVHLNQCKAIEDSLNGA